MTLKVKAIEKKLKFSKDSEGVWRYVMQPELYTSLAQDKVIKEAALRSGVSRGVMQYHCFHHHSNGHHELHGSRTTDILNKQYAVGRYLNFR